MDKEILSISRCGDKMKVCRKCGKIKPSYSFFIVQDGKTYPDCKSCVAKSFIVHDKIRVNGHKSMYENKDSAQYLGVVVGERLCKHLFKDVEVMPYGHSGFDLICNRGKKIDVKTACLTHRGNSVHWVFGIRKNKIADYFICVAFDNRVNLTPLHMWMIPGNEINDKLNTSISPSTIHKWKQWEKDINDVQLCCTTIKGDKS